MLFLALISNIKQQQLLIIQNVYKSFVCLEIHIMEQQCACGLCVWDLCVYRHTTTICVSFRSESDSHLAVRQFIIALYSKTQTPSTARQALV